MANNRRSPANLVDKLNEFTLVFLFTEDLEKVLLQYKLRGPYLHMWNGVGGKVRCGEPSLTGAEREVVEETSADVRGLLNYICTVTFFNGVILHCFCGVLKQGDVRQVEDEPLSWFGVSATLDSSLVLAGDGNIPWLVTEALGILKKKG